MRLVSLQFAYFFNEHMERPDQKYVSINNRLNNLFDASPTIIPFSQGMPLDFPIVQLKSNDGKYNLNMSQARCDFIVNGYLDLNCDDEITKFRLLLQNINSDFKKEKFNRVGLVGKFVYEAKNPIEYINQKFIKQNMSDSKELRVRYNRRKNWDETMLNDIVDITSGNYLLNGKDHLGILIERDINTIKEKRLELNNAKVTDYIDKNIHYLTEEEIVGILK